MFPVAWDYQARLFEFQEEINFAIGEGISAVSHVLSDSTDKTLNQYEGHVDRVEAMYFPSLEKFQQLELGSCRTSAERILNTTTEFTGFSASNCANQYNNRVKVEIDKANKALSAFDDIYSQVQSIVVKSFVGRNVLLNPEDIEDRIKDMFELISGKWEASKPEIASLRRNLEEAISNQNEELGKCHNAVEEDANAEFQRFARMVQTCDDFENSRSSDRLGRASASFEQQLEDFFAEHAKLKLYEWTT